jgi:hypothetical protein
MTIDKKGERERGRGRRGSPAVRKDTRWKLLEQLAIDQCSTESGQHRSIDSRAIPRRVFFFIIIFVFLFPASRPIRSSGRLGYSILSPLAVDVNKSRHES